MGSWSHPSGRLDIEGGRGPGMRASGGRERERERERDLS
jgi:hypothetical protein